MRLDASTGIVRSMNLAGQNLLNQYNQLNADETSNAQDKAPSSDMTAVVVVDVAVLALAVTVGKQTEKGINTSVDSLGNAVDRAYTRSNATR